MVPESNLYMSWVDFIHQPLNRSWWRIDESYVLIIGDGFSASFLLIAPMYLGVLQIDDDNMVFDVSMVLFSAFE